MSITSISMSVYCFHVNILGRPSCVTDSVCKPGAKSVSVVTSPGINGAVYTTAISMMLIRVTWGMTASGGKTVPPPVDNLKLPRTFTEYTEWFYRLLYTCFESSTPRSRRKLNYSIFNIYICFDVIFPHHYTCHSSLYISDNKERNTSC